MSFLKQYGTSAKGNDRLLKQYGGGNGGSSPMARQHYAKGGAASAAGVVNSDSPWSSALTMGWLSG